MEKVKELSEGTRKQYITKLRHWEEYTGYKLEVLVREGLKGFNKLKESDKLKHTATNHHGYLCAMVAEVKYVMKDDELYKVWKSIEEENWRIIEERYDENRPSELQEDKIMDFDEMESIRIKLEKGSFERLLLSFYMLMEPIRADYFATELILPGEESKEENYIVLEEYKLKIQDFKMKKRYGSIDNILSRELIEELEESLKRYPRKYLFVGEDKKTPYSSRKMFSNWACRTLTKALGRPMTLTALRHIYITKKIKEDTPVKDLIDIAKKMGHSRGMQRVYEWK
jgi:integrase